MQASFMQAAFKAEQEVATSGQSLVVERRAAMLRLSCTPHCGSVTKPSRSELSSAEYTGKPSRPINGAVMGLHV
jgi:hypothetical protein